MGDDADLSKGRYQGSSQLRAVDIRHVGESRAEPVVVRPRERVPSCQVQVIRDDDEVSRRQIFSHSTGCVGQQNAFGATGNS